jgi:hypothetical protein
MKLKRFAYKLVAADKIYHAANILGGLASQDDDTSMINEFIKNIAVPSNSPKVEKIRLLKKKAPIYPKDESMIKVLWWEAKRDSLREKTQKFNINLKPSKNERSFLDKVFEELNSRITEAVRDYKDYPEEK